MRLFSNRDRPVHLGAYPAERLPRAPLDAATQAAAARLDHVHAPAQGNVLASICRDYAKIYEAFRDGEPAAERAPWFATAAERSDELKALALFFDATLVGCCRLDKSARRFGSVDGHGRALVVLVDYADHVEDGNPVADLIRGSDGAAARLRAAEVAVVVACYLRQLGFAALAHTPFTNEVALPLLALQAGLARLDGERLVAPFVGDRFALAAVTTDADLAIDTPLAPRRPLEGGLAWWLGVGGTETRWNLGARRRRPGEHGRYPMEKVKRVDTTTTLILDDEVPRLGKRSNGFYRGHKGDFGAKAQREFFRFATKTPVGTALVDIQAAQMRHQDGPVAEAVDPAWADPETNRRAVKTLFHHLGVDMAGTCEAKPYTWYSHDFKGKPIPIDHRHAVVGVIDQGHETMEGASGDDWVSGTQSFRAYTRGGQVAAVVAAWVRGLGYSARSHTNAKSEVVQTPLVLLAGLGEMSRIGETVLNPFIGPRSKSIVMTTDLPLAWDRPIDFGLQDACRKCAKCARECPCDAITYDTPVMFNGYEQWKQDVQRCTLYRMTNKGGAACGRCMKMCPYNNEGLLLHRVLLWVATRVPASRAWLAKLDDRVGHGSINPVKHWWAEIEMVAGKAEVPKHVNRRGVAVEKGFAKKKGHRVGYVNADMLPPPDFRETFPVDRKATLAAADKLETPDEARARRAAGGPRPAHYVQTPPAGDADDGLVG